MELELEVPFSVPILGESFSSLNNPVLLATVDFFTRVRLRRRAVSAPKIAIASPHLRRALTRLLHQVGVREEVSIAAPVSDPKEMDFLTSASLIYAFNLHESPADLAPALSVEDDRAFLTLSRAMNAFAGGFTMVRRGEGAVSLEGNIDAALHLSLKKGRVRARVALESFSNRYPELAQPTWHLLGHTVMEGGRMVRESNPEGLGRLMAFEAAISHALGVVTLGTRRYAQLQPRCYGSKPISSEVMKGELILAPKETLPLPPFKRFKMTRDGVSEVG